MKKLTYLVLLAILIGVVYMVLNRFIQKTNPNESTTSEVSTTPIIPVYQWNFIQGEADPSTGIMSSQVQLIFADTTYDAGTYQGVCIEMDKNNPAIADEMKAMDQLSRIQCWFAGGGDEIGLFKDSLGAYSVKTRTVDEGTAETGGIFGEYKTILNIK